MRVTKGKEEEAEDEKCKRKVEEGMEEKNKKVSPGVVFY